jgi:uncharacterized RDD family membrane protein YckC
MMRSMDSEGPRPPVARLLSVGAKGAGRVAHATGVDRALDEAVEEAVVRALGSPAVGRALERAIQNHTSAAGLSKDEMARVVKQVLESDAAAEVWDEVLQSAELQMLVERIASAPEIRAAIAAQGAGLLTDIGIKLTRVTEALDDLLERIARRHDAESETNQVGLATRVVAAGIDIGLLVAVYSLISSVFASVISFAFGGHLSLAGAIVLGTLGFFAAGGVLVAFWSLAGRTPGMHFLSIRLVHDGSHEISLRRAIHRALGLLVSLVPLGLGFFAILRDPSRRAWHDRMAGTEVVYDSVKRGAPYAGSRPETTAAARAD